MSWWARPGASPNPALPMRRTRSLAFLSSKPPTSPPLPASSRTTRTSPSSPATASTSCRSSRGHQRTSRHEASNSQGRRQLAPHLCHARRKRLSVLYCQGGEERPHPGRGRRDLPLAHRPQPGLAGSRVCEEDELRGLLRARAEDEPVSLSDHRRRMRRPRGGDSGADDARDPLPRQTDRRTRQGQGDGKDPPQIAARRLGLGSFVLCRAKRLPPPWWMACVYSGGKSGASARLPQRGVMRRGAIVLRKNGSET